MMPQPFGRRGIEGRPWHRTGRRIRVQFPRLQRSQTVQVKRVGSLYRFWSQLGSGHDLGTPAKRWNWHRLAWRRNAFVDMVAFGMDRKGRPIGFLDQPASTLEAGELEIYIDTVARECDRFEYVLTGQDRI